jgi:hypothetical protein
MTPTTTYPLDGTIVLSHQNHSLTIVPRPRLFSCPSYDLTDHQGRPVMIEFTSLTYALEIAAMSVTNTKSPYKARRQAGHIQARYNRIRRTRRLRTLTHRVIPVLALGLLALLGALTHLLR